MLHAAFRRWLPALGVASALLLSARPATAQKLVLQGFWWDYWNSNYQNRWADYLVTLAPRLRALGIDQIWIPPTTKGANNGNGYNPFDHYDLGDKWQKNTQRTRMGNKDELLRMVAILHANGIDVVQDVVLNHVIGAGSSTGAGGRDPNAWDDGSTDKYKNFRYACYATPATTELGANYWERRGRWPKNWQNFNPNPGNNSTTGDWNQVMFGPDVSYYQDSYGTSSNATYNPTQFQNYMRQSAREWLIWYKKQEGFDGVRLDAVKNFPDWAAEDFLWNLQNNAAFASGGDQMFAVGEYVGGGSQLDGWCNTVQNRAGTFDFGLRGAIKGLVSGNGNFDMGSIPSAQQQNRVFNYGGVYVHRTVPFVNNHDTFRPIVSTNGNYNTWDSGNELGGGHIDPRDGRLSAAYAVAFAVDGSPQIFFEDLFDLGTTGQRLSHQPDNTTTLPLRADIENLIWCHQNLRFKEGVYKVRHQSGDHLVIERSGKAIIGINDQWTTWQNHTISCDFPVGTVLKDYSGANGTATVTVSGTQTVAINTPPCDGSAAGGRRGYSVWAPVGINQNYNLTPKFTTQEWEMADDLGDRHPLSLQQGGAIPDTSTAWRTAGRVYVAPGQPITYVVTPTEATRPLVLALFDPAISSTRAVDSVMGPGVLTKTYTPVAGGYKTLRIRNRVGTQNGQRAYVKVTYLAPQTWLPAVTGLADEQATDPVATLAAWPNPAETPNDIRLAINAGRPRAATICVLDLLGREVARTAVQLEAGPNELPLPAVAQLRPGLYVVRVPELNLTTRVVIQAE
jgi:alpha-amylase